MITFKFNDDYEQILQAVEGHFFPFEEKGRGLDPQGPLRSCAPVSLIMNVEVFSRKIWLQFITHPIVQFTISTTA